MSEYIPEDIIEFYRTWTGGTPVDSDQLFLYAGRAADTIEDLLKKNAVLKERLYQANTVSFLCGDLSAENKKLRDKIAAFRKKVMRCGDCSYFKLGNSSDECEGKDGCCRIDNIFMFTTDSCVY